MPCGVELKSGHPMSRPFMKKKQIFAPKKIQAGPQKWRWRWPFLAYKSHKRWFFFTQIHNQVSGGGGHPPLQISSVRKMYRKGMVSTLDPKGFGVWVALEPVGGHQLYRIFSEKSWEACKTTQRWSSAFGWLVGWLVGWLMLVGLLFQAYPLKISFNPNSPIGSSHKRSWAPGQISLPEVAPREWLSRCHQWDTFIIVSSKVLVAKDYEQLEVMAGIWHRERGFIGSWVWWFTMKGAISKHRNPSHHRAFRCFQSDKLLTSNFIHDPNGQCILCCWKPVRGVLPNTLTKNMIILHLQQHNLIMM